MAQSTRLVNTGAATVATGNLDPTTIQMASVAISSANILAMNGAPVSVLAAPGSGKAYVIHGILFEFTGTATQYANGGVVTFIAHGGSALHTGSIPAATITSASNSNTWLGPLAGANGTALTANLGVDVTNGTAAFITGTGTAVVKIWYSTVPAL